MNQMMEQVKERVRDLIEEAQEWLKQPKNKFLALGLLLAFFYTAGLLAQFMNNRFGWVPGRELRLPSLNPLKCLAMLFTPYGAKAIGGLFSFLLIAVLFYWMNREDRSGMTYDKERNFWLSNKGVYGTAKWMGKRRMKECFDLTPLEEVGDVNEIILGVKDGMAVSRKVDSHLGPHIAVMGSSGSMKSRTIGRGMIISCAKQGRSLIVTDPKGELASDTMEYLKGYGYEVKILNAVDPYNSHRYDALEGARELPIFLFNIVEAIITNTGGGIGDPIYDHAESALLTALIFLQFEREDIEYPSIKGAYQVMLDTGGAEELDLYFSSLRPPSRALASYNLFKKASDNMKGNICLGLGVRLSIMQNEEIADLMCGRDMDLQAIGKKKVAYFLILSDQDNSTRFVAATFFSLLFLRLVRYADLEAPGSTLPVPVTLLLDEFCSIVGSISGFPQKLSNIRSRGLQVCMIFQSLGQLMNRFPDNLWVEILGNIDTVICLGCSSDPVTAKYISDRSGESTIYADTVMRQRNIFAPSMLQPNFRHSEGAGRRKLLTPDEVMRLPQNEMLVMINHEQLLKLEKFDYTCNPESKKFIRTPIRGMKIVPQPVSIPVPEGIHQLDQHEPAQKSAQNVSVQGRVDMAPPPSTVAKKTVRRSKKTKKEVEAENMDAMQLRIDDYPWGQEKPAVAGASGPMGEEKKSEGMKPSDTIQRISKPDV